MQFLGEFSLYTLIGFTIIMLVIMAIRKAWYWFTVFSGIAGCVIAGEIVSYINVGHSISTQYGIWIENDPAWAYIALVAFFLAMLSLVVHLAIYGMKRKKK